MKKKNFTPQSILSIHYFIHFSIMGIFLPYFNLYCYHLNFSEFQIGIMSATRTLSMVLFSIFWGTISGYFFSRKSAYIICTSLSTLVWMFFLFTSDFWPMLFIMALYSVFYGPIIAFLETYSIEVLETSGSTKKKYGNIRVWGSISFILVAVFVGPITGKFSIEIIIFLILAGSAAQALFSFKMPKPVEINKKHTIKNIKQFFTLPTCLFLICTFFMLISHGTYYGFFSIHLEKLGYSYVFIGIAWGLATFSEIGVMLKSHIIFKRFSLNSILIFSLITSAVRWLILFSAESPPAILFAQMLHAITYGTFHIGCILYIDKLTSKETKTFGQIVNNAVSYGLGIMTGLIINGFFFAEYGPYLFIFSAVSALTGCSILLISFSFKPR